MARPDISTQVRFRKQEEIEKGAVKLREDDPGAKIKMLTSCPSCLQGMARYANDAGGIEPDYIVVEMAKHLLGENWLPEYVSKAHDAGMKVNPWTVNEEKDLKHMLELGVDAITTDSAGQLAGMLISPRA